MDTARLDFNSLNELIHGSNTWCTTFAYWLGVLKPNSSEVVIQEIAGQMAGWYDMEEQAQSIESFENNSDSYANSPEPVPNLFRPIAPVTLAKRWSPFPAAVTVLGRPILLTREGSETAAVFQPKPIPCPPTASSDEQHFLLLLHHACEKALAQESNVLLIGSPGWDYEHEDYIAQDPDLQHIAKEFDYVFYGRKPLPSTG